MRLEKFSQPEKSYVDEAQRIAREMVANEARGPGDLINAMRRIEARYGVPYSLLKALRYNPPSDIMIGVWTRLLNAYEAECERVERKAQLERERIKAIRDATNPSVARAGGGVASKETA